MNKLVKNYEKLYKESLERARNLHKDAIDLDENIRAKQCEIIFPELAESEDEKIRKALIRFHKSSIDIDGIKGEDIIAWLEKQAEKKPATLWHPADGDYLPETDRAVIVLTQKYPLEGNEYAVSFAHRPEESFIQYGKGGWSQPDVKWWLDCDLPK